MNARADFDIHGPAVDRLRRRIEKTKMSYKDRSAIVTASFGVAPLQANRSLEACLEEADAMLYQAKNTGRNKVASARKPKTTTKSAA